MMNPNGTPPSQGNPLDLESYPLTPTQQGMLFHQVHVGRGTGADVEQAEGSLPERLDVRAFEDAWRAVCARHPVLRTRFRWEGLDVPQQEVVSGASLTIPFEVIDLAGEPPETQRARIDAFLLADRTRGFDLGVAPLWRTTLFRCGESAFHLIWTWSHAIVDGVCYFEVLREVFLVYEASLKGENTDLLERPAFRDHVGFLHENLRAKREDAAAFWRTRLAGFVAPTALPTRSHAPGRPAHETPGEERSGHEHHRFRLPRDASDAIKRVAAAHKLHPALFVEAAWALTLAAFAGSDDVVFASTRACRRTSIPGADRILGVLINTVPVRVQLDPRTPLLALLNARRADQAVIRPFENTPLVDILAASSLPRGTPPFDTLVVFNEVDQHDRIKMLGPGWERRDFEVHDQINFPFNVMAYGEPDIGFKLSYERARFDADTVARIASLFGAILVAMGERPEAALGDLPRLPEADARAIFGAFNATTLQVQGPATMHEAFETQVARTPDAVAVVFRGESLTYRELDARADRIASQLASLGIGAGAMVGIFVERSLEMVAGLLGILKAGAAYVPMDPAYPRDRIATMLEDSHAPVVLTLERLRDALPPTTANVVAIDAPARATEPASRPECARATGSDLAYVIFTSGSTGRPKGVQIEHRNVINFFAAMDQRLGAEPGVWLALTSISFDISVLEIFWTLTRGFTVVVQEEAFRQSSAGARPSASRARRMGFSLFYFAANSVEPADATSPGDKYRLLLEGAKFADTHGFDAVWTPERHFHPFGGLYPNPAVTSAAIAVLTKNVSIRAGSVVLPLHNPIRCAEEWSVVDNLSNGRVGLSFASGWHASDFALAPDNFKDRRALMMRGIEVVRALWRGEKVPATGGDGKAIEVQLYPPPVQREPRVWITAGGSPETFAAAGKMGACILTNLLVMKPEEFASNVALYRKAYRDAGHAGEGHITLMLHAFVGTDVQDVRARVRAPFLEYLRTSTDLINKARWELTGFAKGDDRARAAPGAAVTMNLDDLPQEDMDALLDHAFERYFASAGLFGTPESCAATVDRLRGMGVDEIACLIDFGVDPEDVIANLPNLDRLRQATSAATGADTREDDDYGIAAQIRRHRVTHLQCTPSLLGILATDEDALGALRSVRMVLVGGEALPAALVDRLRVQGGFGGSLRNMYGPTETTIWSTTAAIGSAADGITIGGPIANTRVYVVDARLRPVPIGVPGELLIGGAGVVRGYLGRPELTMQRFVADPFGAPGDRLYRTGDIARWLPSGQIEYLGRNDHQVKIRGHRIELSEIESVLRTHPAVHDAVVVARRDGQDDGQGEARLVAYVVAASTAPALPAASREGVAREGRASMTSAWQTIWDETYRASRGEDSGREVSGEALNLAGWQSSFTGQPIPASEMREWVECTVARALSLARVAREGSPRPRVLEIGFGTGMILQRIAPDCAEYVGVDFSSTALELVASQLEARGIRNVRLERLAADALGALAAPGTFDLVIVNSVVQYFPDASYLAGVLESAYARLSPGGAIFVGDVRSLPHLHVFHAAIELAQAPDEASLVDLEGRVQRRIAGERELVVDPRFFERVGADLGADVTVELKAGWAQNEMTRFRYDVVLRKGGDDAHAALLEAAGRVEAPEPCSLDALRSRLASATASVRFAGILNRHLAADVRASEAIHAATGSETAGDFRARLHAMGEGGLHPEDVRGIHPDFEASITFAPGRLDRMDVFFRRRSLPETARPERAPHAALSPDMSGLGSLANRPAGHGSPVAEGSVVPSLRTLAREKLPEYMVPGAFVVLDAFPLTPNGKVDRGALPAPERVRDEKRAAPREAPTNEVERAIVTVLQELVGLDVGVDDNFFDVGANSLILVQASVKLRALLERPIPLVRMFQYPTARSLATASVAGAPGDEAARKEGEDRAQLRRDAMQHRRDQRAAARPRR